ncbi:YeeE/YedE thiosulfate transporter family protein [Sphingobium sp. DEHP117]|uniref:YeeE/YedE thiosulfate transporter family protein n=1 Tax=Sphingobium sp. DEHP117 TaxID=2993436 RepID=UPI0027D59865|nr:YeeE/YedE thiosulfate transporter family protein [Sphingobium sp. DEHP117]MDQ4419262.1 YeeE/YedE thiosulfate transporter family protein [Sphingobium sp. DEHP117]
MSPAAAFSLIVAIACAVVMGFAINRGATCMVSAVDEVVRKRRFTRFVALGEAALWVAGGIALGSMVGLMPETAPHPGLSAQTVVGGALLGLGAYVNKACVFGSVARFGSGEWHYALTPLGFLAGCVVALPWLGNAGVRPSALHYPNFPLAVGIALTLFALWRGIGVLLSARAGMLARHIWAPHQATAVIGVTFVILLLTAGMWTYPEALAQLARGMTMESSARLTLFVALLAGAVWSGGGIRSGAGGWSGRRAMRCVAGGALMGMGSLMIPGGNDSLILIGLPFLQPYAWAALAAMAGTIALCLMAEERAQRMLDSLRRPH